MRWLSRVGALLIAAAIGGCAIIEAEKDNRGGFLDQAADDLWMRADSKKMRALRAVAIEASLARIAMITPKSAPDRALLARRIGETTKRADVVRQCAFVERARPCFYFDSVMVDYENALFDLALVALPIDDARTLLTRVGGGVASVSINPLELVQSLLDIGREAFRVGRVVGAIYRDTLELEVQVWLMSPAFADFERARGVPEEFIVTFEKIAGLRAVYARGNDNIPAWRAEIAALRSQGLEPVPDVRIVQEIYSILSYICGQIVTKQDPSWRECALPDLTQVQVASSAGGTLFGRGPVVVGVGRGGGGGGGGGAVVGGGGPTGRPAVKPQDPAAKPAAVTAADTNKDYALIIARYDPKVHITPVIKPLLRRLCVPSGDLDRINDKTIALVKVYQQTASRAVTGKLTNEEINLLQNMAACTTGLNFYEANDVPTGINSADNIALYNKVLPNGSKLPANATPADVRRRLPEVRREVQRRLNRNLEITEPQVSDQLTLDLFNALIEIR